MTSSLPAKPNETIVVNTGPLIAISKMGIERFVGLLPYRFVTPVEVRDEMLAGAAKGHQFGIPGWVKITRSDGMADHRLLSHLDKGEASVIQLALDLDASFVCIDERKARRFAAMSGLAVIGSLGLLARAKNLGLIDAVAPFIRIAEQDGIFYDKRLIAQFLIEMKESVSVDE
jgi:predicted nucleic acid-binding protein